MPNLITTLQLATKAVEAKTAVVQSRLAGTTRHALRAGGRSMEASTLDGKTYQAGARVYYIATTRGAVIIGQGAGAGWEIAEVRIDG